MTSVVPPGLAGKWNGRFNDLQADGTEGSELRDRRDETMAQQNHWSTVSTDISGIHFQGARIVRVIEDADRGSLTFEVSYPLTERDSDFPRGKLIFAVCSRYLVEEGLPYGEPVIQRAEVVEEADWGVRIRIHTNHGIREVSCYSVSEESPFTEPDAQDD